MSQVSKSDLEFVLGWFARGHVGLSSKTMAFCAAGIPFDDTDHPYDPSDFNRCLLAVSEIPCVRGAFPEIAKLSPQWRRLIARWDDIESSFVGEVGWNWEGGNRAPETYQLMQEVLGG